MLGSSPITQPPNRATHDGRHQRPHSGEREALGSRAKGGQFVTHVKALPDNPYDGHTLANLIPDMETLVGNTIALTLADK
ncbi:hypothetical protein ABIC10_009276 [Bradyrhizobium sp. S3.2.12]